LGEMLAVALEAGADRVDPAFELGTAARLAPQRVEIGRDRACERRVALGIALGVAQQEVLLGPTAVEQLHRELMGQPGQRARLRGRLAVHILRAVAEQIDAADEHEAADADRTDRRNLVGDTHRGPLESLPERGRAIRRTEPQSSTGPAPPVPTSGNSLPESR